VWLCRRTGHCIISNPAILLLANFNSELKMGKRKRPALTEKMIRMIIDRLDALNEEQIAEELCGLIPDLLGAKGVTKAAGDFTLLEVVQTFGLNYIIMPGEMEPHTWRIEDSKLDFTMTPCLGKLPLTTQLTHELFGDSFAGEELF
jgi:hypothetical protein